MNKIAIRAGDDERVIMKGLKCGTILLHDTIENQEQKVLKSFQWNSLQYIIHNMNISYCLTDSYQKWPFPKINT